MRGVIDVEYSANAEYLYSANATREPVVLSDSSGLNYLTSSFHPETAHIQLFCLIFLHFQERCEVFEKLCVYPDASILGCQRSYLNCI